MASSESSSEDDSLASTPQLPPSCKPTLIILNVQSIYKKLPQLVFLFKHDEKYQKADCICLTETYMVQNNTGQLEDRETIEQLVGKNFHVDGNDDATFVVEVFKELGYQVFRCDRTTRSGGVVWLVKSLNDWNATHVKSVRYIGKPIPPSPSNEDNKGHEFHLDICCIRCTWNEQPLFLVGVYMHKGTDNNWQKNVKTELRTFFQQDALLNQPFVIAGDFNRLDLSHNRLFGHVMNVQHYSHISNGVVTFWSRGQNGAPSSLDKCYSYDTQAYLPPLRMDRVVLGGQDHFPIFLQSRNPPPGSQCTLDTMKRRPEPVEYVDAIIHDIAELTRAIAEFENLIAKRQNQFYDRTKPSGLYVDAVADRLALNTKYYSDFYMRQEERVEPTFAWEVLLEQRMVQGLVVDRSKADKLIDYITKFLGGVGRKKP